MTASVPSETDDVRLAGMSTTAAHSRQGRQSRLSKRILHSSGRSKSEPGHITPVGVTRVSALCLQQQFLDDVVDDTGTSHESTALQNEMSAQNLKAVGLWSNGSGSLHVTEGNEIRMAGGFPGKQYIVALPCAKREFKSQQQPLTRLLLLVCCASVSNRVVHWGERQSSLQRATQTPALRKPLVAWRHSCRRPQTKSTAYRHVIRCL